MVSSTINWFSYLLQFEVDPPSPPSYFPQIGLSLLVSLVAGAIAGISGAIVSAPADLLLTKSAGASAADGDEACNSTSSGGELDTTEASEGGMLDGVFAGVGVRCVFFAASIAVQVL